MSLVTRMETELVMKLVTAKNCQKIIIWLVKRSMLMLILLNPLVKERGNRIRKILLFGKLGKCW
jgi:hypothetical protein